MKQIIKISGTTIKTPPAGLQYSRYNLTKSGRTTAGKMKMDLVAKKKKLYFEYPSISSADKKSILSLIDSDAMFFLVCWIEDDTLYEKTMYVGEINWGTLRSGINGQWWWKDFKFNLIEQ